jgi:hypothetical protein
MAKLDLGQPWSLEPLRNKHYGTRVVDRDGDVVLTFWSTDGDSVPSVRQKEWFGDWTPEAWSAYVSDSHWECEHDLRCAERVIELVNADGA